MTLLDTLRKMKVTVRLVADDRLTAFGSGDREAAISFIRENKEAIIAELKASDLPNPDLPAACPFNTGDRAPAGCRFSHDLLMTLILTGAMPDPDVGCMFKHMCGETTPFNKGE